MVAPSSSTVRVKRLHELVDRALDTTVTSLGGAKEFTRCFAVGDAERAFLATAYDEALGKFRANVKEEVIKTLDETRAAEDLARLDTLLAQQPQLKDGKRCLAPSQVTPRTAVARAAREQRASHKRKLQAMLAQLEAENGALHSQVKAKRAESDAVVARVGALYA